MRIGVSAVIASSVLAATFACAAGLTPPRGGVRGSVHDMFTVLKGALPDPEARVCPYCHTPHHAMDEKDPNLGVYLPLWSRAIPPQNYPQYGAGADSSALAAKVGAIDPLIGPTRLCLSCHDGSLAPDEHTGVASPSKVSIGGAPASALESPTGKTANRYLQGTHPIGFRLVDAVAADSNKANSGASLSYRAGIDTTAAYLGHPDNKTISSQLYEGYMTCSTCHDVHNREDVPTAPGTGIDTDHIDTLGRNYLLFSPQSGSQLCLSCHLK